MQKLNPAQKQLLHKIAPRMKMLRKEQGLTQKQLGEKIGISRGSIVNYEHEFELPNEKRCRQLAKALGVPVDYLKGKTDYPGACPVDDGETWFDEEEEFNNKIRSITSKGGEDILDYLCVLPEEDIKKITRVVEIMFAGI